MSRVFLSHSSRDSLQAIALKRWLVEQVPGLEDEIFLDLDPYTGIAPGERWKEALRRANERCEVVICLISAHWESSRECLTEYRTAENLGKLILCARLEPVESITREWQRCDLFGDGPASEIPVNTNGRAGVVVFRTEALQQLRRGLRKAGIGAEHFAWPPSSDPDRAPYRGWEPLQETDAAVFFGRDGQIVRGLDALRGMRSSGVESLFVILGPSGTGKSSFLRAGLLPRLRREDRHFLPLEIVRPERSALTGEQGFARAVQELRTGLGLRHPSLGQIKEACVRNNTDRIREWLLEARNVAAERLQEAPEETEDPESLEESPAPTLVLPLDQAEELFNADAGPEAAGFLDLVARLLEYDDGTGPALIVASTIRADFYEALQTAPQLVGIKSVVFDELKPMPVVQFKEVILGPAARATAAGHPLTLEPALVDRLLADCTAGADTLPLLALTLARLYQDYGASGQLTLAEYQAMGGLQRVVQTEVDALLSHHPEQRQRQLALLRSAFIPWLATINPDNDQPIRRVASLADLPGDARPLVDAMVDKRLLVQDNRGGETVIEVALESLLRQWDELAGWLAAEREDLKEADNLERAAAAWERSSRNEAWLFEGGRLIGAERLSARPGFRNRLDPNRAFLLASRAREEKRSAAEKRRKEAELRSAREKQEAAEAHAAVLRKRSKVLRMVLAVTAVIALVAVLGFVLASIAQKEARANANEAIAHNKEATALQLAAEGQSMLAGARPGGELRGMQQMLAAQSLVQTSEGERVIVGAVVAQRDVHKMVQVTPASEERPASPVNSAAFSPDGKLAVSGSANGSIRLWDAETGEQVWEQAKAHEGAVKSVAFSPDDDGGARIVSGGEDGTIRLWDTETGKSRGEPLTGHDGFINSVAFSPNDGGARIVSGGEDGTVRLWDAESGEQLMGPMGVPGSPVKSVAIDPAGTRIASGGADNIVRVWGAISGQQLFVLEAHGGQVNGVAFSPDGNRLASASNDRRVVLWDLATGQPSATMTGHTNWVLSVAFSPDGERLVSGSTDYTLQMWNVETGEPIGAAMTGHGLEVWSVDFSSNGRRILSGMGDGTIRLWNAASVPMEQASWVLSLGISPEADRAVSGGGDGTMTIWNLGTRTAEGEMSGHQGPVLGIAFSPDGNQVVSAGADGTVRLWNSETGDPVGEPMTGHEGHVNSVAFSPDGKLIVSGGADKTVRLWNAETNEPVGEPMIGHEGDVNGVAFSPKGQLIVSGGDDKTVRLWDAKTGKQRGDALAGHEAAVNGVAFSHDGKRVASASSDKTVRLWDANTGEPAAEPMRGHESAVNHVAFSPDGRYIASGGADRMVRLWDATGKSIGDPMAGHWDAVKTVAFSSDSRQVISGSQDNSVRVWPVPKDWTNALCAKLTRNISEQEWRQWISSDFDYDPPCPELPVPGGKAG